MDLKFNCVRHFTRLVLITTLLGLNMYQVHAQFMSIDRSSKISFAIKHFGFLTDGGMSGLSGKIFFNRSLPDSSRFDVTADAATIQTGVDLRDKHLKGQSYFDVEKYPTIRFVSKKVEKVDQGAGFIVTGELTIRDITRGITFPFTATPENRGYRLKGSFVINRRDFKIGDTGVISDEVRVSLEVLISPAN
jgi:polyisoprenoid-binding protein YceI